MSIEDQEGSEIEALQKETSKMRRVVWTGILFAYAVLCAGTGYIAFFQEPYNPAANPSLEVLEKLETEGEVRDYFITVLKAESDAFEARKDLAAQSFNVVLGALLGFLSASAVQNTRRREQH